MQLESILDTTCAPELESVVDVLGRLKTLCFRTPAFSPVSSIFLLAFFSFTVFDRLGASTLMNGGACWSPLG